MNKLKVSFAVPFSREIAEAELARLREQVESLQKQLKLVQSAAINGMNAAHEISRHELATARKLHSESRPDAVESERSANALLTDENERLRERVAELEKDNDPTLVVQREKIYQLQDRERLLLEAVRWLCVELKGATTFIGYEIKQPPAHLAPLIAEAIK